MRLNQCIVPVDTELAMSSHNWVTPVIGETVVQCSDCLHVITLDTAWNEEDARHMAAQVEVDKEDVVGGDEEDVVEVDKEDVVGGEPSAPTEH